ncbi:MAG TPA: AMP-binding protein [Gaiellales bacterium]|jgi:crotonobetaine/carnitine-CoA ligase|nr:AMP-binding protein [Gaiellales bacterium]
MPQTIPELFDEAVAAAPDKVWLVAGDESFTYAEARARIGRAAAALRAAGLRPGEPVLATMRNTPDHLFTWLASAYAGTILVTANPRSAEAELAGLVGQVRPRLIVSDAPLPGAVAVERLFEEEARFDGTGPAGPDDAAVLIPTSGTTGRSKLVTQTHRAYVMAGEGFPWWMQLGPDDRLMTSLPLFHINAPTYSMLGSVAAGASLALLPGFSASGFLASARKHGATEFNAIGAMLEILMRQPERPDDADTPLRLCYTGPAPPKERHLEIERRFGLRIVCGYAMSETPYGTIWPRGTRPFGTLGSIRQHPTLGVVNEGRVMRDGGPAWPGEVGELELRNPAVMKGYWGMPEETAKVLSDDGWLRTGDLVTDDGEGTYTFVGRVKEVIRRRGENVAPAEIEEALVDHPAVFEAAVVGVPSELSEEDIKAFVVLHDPAADLAAVRDHAAGLLAPFKVPRYMQATAELPHTPTGRVAKHEITRERTPDEIDFERRA